MNIPAFFANIVPTLLLAFAGTSLRRSPSPSL